MSGLQGIFLWLLGMSMYCPDPNKPEMKRIRGIKGTKGMKGCVKRAKMGDNG